MTGEPSDQHEETRFQFAGTVSATSYVPGLRFANVLEALPASPVAVVVRTNGDGLRVVDVKLNEPKPSSVIFHDDRAPARLL